MPDAAQNKDSSPRRGARRGWRRVVFPLATLLVGLLPFVLLELVLTVLGIAGPERLFVLDGSARHYVTNPRLLRWFEPQAFPREKPSGEFRVFCVGASTVQGRPYRTATAFSTWLQLALSGMDPAGRYRVVNVGGVSYASYRLRPIVDELLDYEPDLLVLYTGHNEFLEDRTRAGLHEPGVVGGLRAALGRLRTYRVLRSGLEGATGTRDPSGGDVVEILNRTVGLDEYRRDLDWHRAVQENYERNLRAMLRAANGAHVPLILVNPASNSSTCRPFKSQHGAGLAPSQQERVEELIERARERYASEPEGAVAQLAEAESIDPLYAETHYWNGKALESLGLPGQALEAYLRAKDLDVCPLRILEPMRRSVLEIARHAGTPLIDARAVFEQSAGTPLLGKMFLDHVHPTIEGHQLLADALAEEIQRLGLVSTRADWSADARAAVYEHYYDALLRDEPQYLIDGRLGVAQVLAWVHRYDEAETQLGEVLAEHPRAAPAWLQLGQLHARLGRTERAVAAWEEAIELEAERAGDLLSTALFEAQSESYDAAQLALETLLKHNVAPLVETEAQYALAVIHLLQDDPSAARRAFAKVGLDSDDLRSATRTAPPLSWWSRYGRLLPRLEAL